jgi:hypothetical protein
MGDSKFPPVGLISDLQPWESPQYIPGDPHNLPALLDRPSHFQFTPSSSPLGPTGPATPIGAPAPLFDAHHYADMGGEVVQAVNVASIIVMPQPSARRNILLIRNSGTTNIFLSFGQDASANSVLKLASGQQVLFDEVVPQDDVYAFSDVAAGQVTAVQGTVSYSS